MIDQGSSGVVEGRDDVVRRKGNKGNRRIRFGKVEGQVGVRNYVGIVQEPGWALIGGSFMP